VVSPRGQVSVVPPREQASVVPPREQALVVPPREQALVVPPREQVSVVTPLRLTLGDDGVPSLGAQLLSHFGQRCMACVWDFSVTLAIGLLAFLISGTFWIPFAVGMICYHAAGGLVLGNTPGAFLFGRRNAFTSKGDTSGTSPDKSCLPATGGSSLEASPFLR